MSHAVHYLSLQFVVGLLLLPCGFAAAATPHEVRIAKAVCRQLSAKLSLANARLQPAALEQSRRLGELGFVLTALDEEVQVQEEQLDRLERSEHPDAPQAVQQIRLRMQELVRRRQTLRKREEAERADHMRLVLDNGESLPVEPRIAWRTSLDAAIRALTPPAAPSVAKTTPERTVKAGPASRQPEPRRTHPCRKWQRR